MAHFDWRLTIRANIFTLRMMGLWPKHNKKYEFNLYLLYAFVVIFFFAVVHILTLAINVFFIYNNFDALMKTTYILVTELLSLVKIYFFTKNIQIVKQLLTMLDKKPFQPRTVKQKVLIEKDLKLWTQMYSMLWVSCIAALLFWAIFPILDGSYREGQLPFLAWYPFDFGVTPMYQITYVYQILSTSVVAMCTSNIDTFLAALNLFAGAQFDVLCDNLKQLNLCEDDSKSKEDLKICFQHHREILSFGESINKFLDWIVFFQFFASAVTIGLAMFQLTVIAPFSSEFYSVISFGGAVIVEIFMYCWYGNELTLKSRNLAYAIFEADWSMASIELSLETFIKVTYLFYLA
ncbi:odorant receptor 82a-like [Zophobas morio]|uniref:odorant receptor 82a-like n=1 Tax=Zophobas morio TaxID=2755281 RepID=UPI0030830CE9